MRHYTSEESFDSQADFEVSTDGGKTFTAVQAAAPVGISVTGVGSTVSGMFDTVMTGFSTTLSGGVMVRQSTVNPSRGETQIVPQPDGTRRISSFFDIFTDVSLDGGNTWSPATNGAVRMALTKSVIEVPSSSPNLPITNTPYISPEEWQTTYANGIILTNVIHYGFTGSFPLPGPGNTNTESFGSTVSGSISLNNGQTFSPFSAPASVTVQVNSRSDLNNNGTSYYDTLMPALNVSGGTLPAGVMLRASPTRASLGRATERQTADGNYRISSFFDIFTDISLDGGNTWSPTTSPPKRMTPRLPAKLRVFSGPNMPPPNSQYLSPAKWRAQFANGVVISNVVHTGFLENFAPPGPQSTNMEFFSSQVTFLMSMGPDQPFLPMTANADCVVSVGSSGLQSSEQVFQTVMQDLELSGGSLPANVLVRTSPTLLSLGETRFAPAQGGDYQISSYFDIFTEISLDGGVTWSAADAPCHMELHIDPSNPPTTLMQPQVSGKQLTFNVTTQPGLLYTVQYKNNLTDPAWKFLTAVSGNGQSLTVTDPLAGNPSSRFYEVVISEDPNQ